MQVQGEAGGGEGMNEEKYRVILYDDQIMAENMSYGTALLLVEIFLEKFYEEKMLRVTIERQAPKLD